MKSDFFKMTFSSIVITMLINDRTFFNLESDVSISIKLLNLHESKLKFETETIVFIYPVQSLTLAYLILAGQRNRLAILKIALAH
ncbi:Uncharacterised protein [Vibrio cholerae]|nr:Uncharacterised protein [Vibrio cholerae]